MEQTLQQTDVLSTLSNQLADAIERISPALVLVNGRPRQPGSGIVYAADHVLTADHVLEREGEITIETHDGRLLPAEIAGRDRASDLALLKVPGLGLTPPPLAERPARVGQMVLAVGRPGNTGPMASSGLVSSLGGPLRTGNGTLLDHYIRIDATPYPGFSGGPLLDATGAVLGLLTTGLVNGVALAIPAPDAWRIAGILAQHGHVRRGYLGLGTGPVELPEGQGASPEQASGLLVVRVEPDGPAAKGGLQVDDIVIALDGQPTPDTDSLQALLTGERVGTTVPVTILRGGTAVTQQVTVGERS